MNILALTKYDRYGASSRLRFYQYRDAFLSAGHQLDISPLFTREYLEQKYASRVNWALVLSCYWKHLRSALQQSNYHAVWVEKELFPYMPLFVEKPFIRASTKLVLDYDDAIFHNYDMHSSFWVQTILAQKLDRLMARADVVVGGNTYLCQRAEQAGCHQVEQIPTVVDMQRYKLDGSHQQPEKQSKPIVGWIGSPATAHYLKLLAQPLQQLAKECQFSALAIGARKEQLEGLLFDSLGWSEETETELIASLDIGLMPLENTPWEQGKCGYKLIQYMASGLPVIASNVGANKDIVKHGVNGYLVNSESEWLDSLRKLALDPVLRKKMGMAGRRMVEETYSLQAQSGRLIELFEMLYQREKVA